MANKRVLTQLEKEIEEDFKTLVIPQEGALATGGDMEHRAITFGEFAQRVYPFVEIQNFHRVYYRLLEMFARGKIRKLMVSMPPQHGKSIGASTLLPAYMLGLNPDLRVAIASYSSALAN